MLSKYSRKFSTTPLGCALVPEVNRMMASSSGCAACAGSPGAQRASSANSVPGSDFVRAPDPQPRRGRCGQQIVELQAVLIQNELRLQPLENIVELVAVHLDMDGAERRAVGHDAEIAEQLLDRIVGEQRDPVVRPETALAQQRGEAADRLAQLAVADGCAHRRPTRPMSCPARQALRARSSRAAGLSRRLLA